MNYVKNIFRKEWVHGLAIYIIFVIIAVSWALFNILIIKYPSNLIIFPIPIISLAYWMGANRGKNNDGKRQQAKEKEINEALEILDEVTDKFGSEFDLVRVQIEKRLNLDTKYFLKIIREGRTVRKSIYSTIANISGNMVESGQYHIYRGVLNPMGPGEGLLKIFDTAVEELVRLGDTDAENAEKQKKAIRENIKRVG